MSKQFTLLHPEDDVCIALQAIVAGTPLENGVSAAAEVPSGHKIALRAVARGEPVHRYNQIIGFASQDITPGDHVHLHNLAMQCGGSDGHSGISCNPALCSIAKGGTTNLNEVYQYAEPVEAGKGLVFMDAPSFDPVGATAQVAGGTILDGEETVEESGRKIFEHIIAVASGEPTRSEILGYGEEEFCPWDLGIML